MTAIYTSPRCLEHGSPGHPESPSRVTAALAPLRELGDCFHWPSVSPAEPSDVTRVHDERLVRRVEEVERGGGGWVDPDTFVGPGSWNAALDAVGANLQAVSDVLSGSEPNAFVVVRPPGHHATRSRSMGFCLFNNVAVAAQWALSEGGASRVAVLDLDVHHGNGTQDIFYDRNDVFYYSTHQFPFYPGTGSLREVGVGDGVGTTVNVPLPAGCGDASFLRSTETVLVPSVRGFAPDLILVSLGFDAHWADPLAQMRLTLEGYANILATIRNLAEELCGGRLVITLEGGYDLNVVREGARLTGSILLGQVPAPDPLGQIAEFPEPDQATLTIDAVRAVHQL